MKVLYLRLMPLLASLPAVTLADDITVTATRLEKSLDQVPAAVSVVEREDLQRARQQIGLDESLTQVPGLFMQDRYNFSQDLRVSIRGFGARANFGIRGVRIFVDGIPETLPDGQGQVDSIDLGSVERVTVLRGSSSALYGNASGGVILIDSERPPENVTVDARLSLGELGFSKHQLKAGGTTGRWGWLVNAANFEMEGFRAQSDVVSRSLNGNVHYAPGSNSNVRISFNHTDQPVSEDAGGLTRAQVDTNPRQAAPANITFDAGESLEQTRVGVVFDTALNERNELAVRNYYVWRSFENTLAFQAGGAVTIDRFFTGGGLAYTNHGATIAGRDNRLNFGLDIDSQRDHRKRFDNLFGTLGTLSFSQIEKVTNVGVFVQDELALSDRLALTLGARHDSVRFDVNDRFQVDGDESGRRTLSQTSPMAALLYSVSRAINIYTNIGTSFETPTTTELANPDGGGFNRALEPQIATNYESGVKGVVAERNRYSLSVFHIDVKDELVPFELPASPGRSFFRNAGRSTRNGFELGAATELGSGLSLSIAYTYSDFAFDRFIDNAGNDFRGNRIPGLPRNVVHGQVTWRHARGLFASLDSLYVDRFFVDNANEVDGGEYTLANLRAGYTRDRESWRWSVFAGANNVLGEGYAANTRINAAFGRYFEPGPARNIYGGVELRWVY
jgi:iron complex outermembrane recepter protein